MNDVTFKMNEASLVRAIQEHHKTFRRSYEKLFLVASKGIAAKAVRLTPPFQWKKSAKETESDRDARKRGIRSVEIGVSKVFTTSIETARKNGFTGPLTQQDIQRNSALSLMQQLHAQNKNKNGRVPKNHKPTQVVTKQALRLFLSKTKKQVGYLASGWIQGASLVQASIPSWVKKHSGAGSATLKITKTQLTFKMTNAVQFSSKFALLSSRIPVAIRMQAAAMLRQILFKAKQRVVL